MAVKNTLGLLLGDNGDIVLVNGRLAFVKGASLIRQRWGIKSSIFKGEWYLNKNLGLPYHDEIFRKGITEKRIRELFRQLSYETEGVIRVIDINPGKVNPRTRVLENLEVRCIIEGPPLA